ncbi:hypothetical protein NFJ02_15g20370 [Pycnococcus provasolii]
MQELASSSGLSDDDVKKKVGYQLGQWRKNKHTPPSAPAPRTSEEVVTWFGERVKCDAIVDAAQTLLDGYGRVNIQTNIAVSDVHDDKSTTATPSAISPSATCCRPSDMYLTELCII